MYQNYINVIFLLFRTIKAWSQKSLRYIENMFKKRTRSKWKVSINKSNLLRSEPTWSQQSKDSSKSSRRASNCMRPIIRELWAKTKNWSQKSMILREKRKIWKMNMLRDNCRKKEPWSYIKRERKLKFCMRN